MAGLGELLAFNNAFPGYLNVKREEVGGATFMYYQYVNKYGDWYMMRIEDQGSDIHEQKFARDSTMTVSAAWTARANGFTYQYPNFVFKDLVQ